MCKFNKIGKLEGVLEVSGDKSITHRALIYSSLSKGTSVIKGGLLSQDIYSTVVMFRDLGVKIDCVDGEIRVSSRGILKSPSKPLDCGNSGTTARLMLGVLSGLGIDCELVGDKSLSKRPMMRVAKHLIKLGADIELSKNGEYIGVLPAKIRGAKLHGGVIESEVASAQVKSAILFAGMLIDEDVEYVENVKTRNHTERLALKYGGKLSFVGKSIISRGRSHFKSADISIGGDFSSAAFFICGVYMFEGSNIVIKNVGVNPSRVGLIKVLNDLGGKVSYSVVNEDVELTGDIRAEYSKIVGGVVCGDIVANIIDEIPALGYLGLFSENGIEVRDAGELRFKESDRIKAVLENVRELGGAYEEYDDGFKVYPLKNSAEIPTNCVLKSYGDHRICMLNVLVGKKFWFNGRIGRGGICKSFFSRFYLTSCVLLRNRSFYEDAS